jgi:hypothetical protein
MAFKLFQPADNSTLEGIVASKNERGVGKSKFEGAVPFLSNKESECTGFGNHKPTPECGVCSARKECRELEQQNR